MLNISLNAAPKTQHKTRSKKLFQKSVVKTGKQLKKSLFEKQLLNRG
nr:MAG TPA: hypothetical protein [Caudoviricetes sp.]